MSYYDQTGGVKCGLCGSEGTNKTTCPLNPACTNVNLSKHPLAVTMMNKAPITVAKQPASEPIKKVITSTSVSKTSIEPEGDKETPFSSLKTSETKTNPIIKVQDFNPERQLRPGRWILKQEGDYDDNSEIVKFFKPLANKEMMFEYKGEPLVVRTKFTGYDDDIRLKYTLNYADEEKIQAFIDTCTDRRFYVFNFNMAFQEWTIKDGKLYLENQENIHTLCKDEYAKKIFQGAARILWCIFLHNGLSKKIFDKGTVIELEAWGNLANDKIGDASQKALELFYKKLGFKYTGGRAPSERGSGGPYMQATVGDVIDHVCDRLPKDLLKALSTQ